MADIRIPLRICRSFDGLTPEIIEQDMADALSDWMSAGYPAEQAEIERLLPYNRGISSN